ncbi:MAG: hypothetical protein GC186_07740 [Rhodobacteraceae bacterium]|nr:hypothetical protein [Paracoccaceae bacterium]
MALFPFVIIAVFVGMWLARRGSTLTRECRWRADGDAGQYRCAACGAVCTLPPGKKPRQCLKPPPA